ncbi:hypothetical protein GCM10010116_02580 [Microbispora rosea subsp. aerata]|nr:hypothetical protein GCM10010116_02580 [Microbispora rosea subsp. aerata]
MHRAGEAKRHGHASTRSWLRTSAGMTSATAGRVLALAVELARLPRVREAFAAGHLAAGVVEAICQAISGLTDDQARLAEPILLELAGKAGPAEVAKAGRYLRAVLDPDGEERDEQADYTRRFLRVRPGAGGGMEGEFYLPREAAARLRALLDAYAKPKAEGDDRPLRVRYADAFIALLEDKIVTELLVLVSAESLPTDPEPADPVSTTDHHEDIEDTQDAHDAEDVSASGDIGSCEEPSGADDTGDSALGEAGDNTSDSAPDRAVNPGGADRSATSGTCHSATAHAEAGHAESATRSATFEAERADSGERWEDAQNAEAIEDSEAIEDIEDGRDAEVAQESCRATTPADHAENTRQRGHAQGQGPRSGESRWGRWRSCDPPGDTCAHHAPWDTCAHHTHAGPRPAGEAPRGLGRADEPSGPRPAGPESAPEPGPGTSGAPGVPPQEPARSPRPEPGTLGTPDSRPGVPGTPPGAAGSTHGMPRGTGRPGTSPRPEPGVPGSDSGESPLGTGLGTAPGPLFGTAAGAALGASGLVPGLLLATGQVLPVSSVHRLARTSTLMRIVMDADGQVLDMGRKVRLATPAQRRAIFARYATCWVDGCPLPATLCQIDHADNWSTGGLTDLKLLGPACQFHNRDRYRHPDRYTRRKVGIDRWAFTYHRLGGVRRL